MKMFKMYKGEIFEVVDPDFSVIKGIHISHLRKLTDKSHNLYTSNILQDVVEINDFVEDLNYRRILLRLDGCDFESLSKRLEKDKLNKVYRLELAEYMYVTNCDFQGEEFNNKNDVLEMIEDEQYILYQLVSVCGRWFYYKTDF